MIPDECPTCGNQWAYTTRLGVKLTTRQASIFDLIEKAGLQGISTTQALGRTGIKTKHTLQAHCTRINERIIEAGYRIISVDYQWHLMRYHDDT